MNAHTAPLPRPMDPSRALSKRKVNLGELIFGKRRKQQAVRRKQHLREVFKPAVRGLFRLPREVILRIFSFLDPPDRENLGAVHPMFRFVNKEIARVLKAACDAQEERYRAWARACGWDPEEARDSRWYGWLIKVDGRRTDAETVEQALRA